jgi:RNA polymerase sigma-70 factor (ECF subfamily)
MEEMDWLARRFEENHEHLRGVAYRMLGSESEADDALQEAWLKLTRSDTGEVENLGGWLTTVVARVCLDMLRARKLRREEPLAPVEDAPGGRSPEHEMGLAEAVGPALLIVLDTLAPAERVAFVLHDMFDLSFEEIALIVDRSPAAARQLASRARRRVRGAAAPAADVARHRQLVGAFLAASRNGDFEGLVAVLSPEVVLRADELAIRKAAANERNGAPKLAPETRGASQVADAFKGRAGGALPALIDDEAGAVWALRDQVLVAFVFTMEHQKIAGIELVMEPARIAELDIEIDTGTDRQ